MAPPTLYDMCVPTMTRMLQNLSAILTKASDHASATNTPLSTLTSARLIADMDPLPNQIHRASDSAKGVAVRLGGLAPIPMPDTERTFPELQARIQATLDILARVDAASMQGKEDVALLVKTGPNEFAMTGKTYVQDFALPNFFFHVTTAYAILRSVGVPVGKMDYLGSIPTQGEE